MGGVQRTVEFGTGLVDCLKRRARQFDLPARLQRNGAAASLVEQADQRRAIVDRLPGGCRLQTFQQGADAALPRPTLIGNWREVTDIKGDFFVFRADPEAVGCLAASFKPGDELVTRRHGRRIGHIAGHFFFLMSVQRPALRSTGLHRPGRVT